MAALVALIAIAFVLGYWLGKARGYEAGYRHAAAELSGPDGRAKVIDIRPRD
jgi:UPF0716 family protein affecting phage T7 exclusion